MLFRVFHHSVPRRVFVAGVEALEGRKLFSSCPAGSVASNTVHAGPSHPTLAPRRALQSADARSFQVVAATDSTRSDGAKLVYRPGGADSAQNPAVSPDGKILLFTVFHDGYNNGAAGLYELPVAGGRVTRVLDDGDHDNVNLPGPAWNALTGRIAFASDVNRKDEIWTMASHGGALVQVTRHRGTSHFIEPSFSPDGKWIVFEVDPNVPDGQIRGSIWKIRADGTGLTQLTAGKAFDDRQPNWSPKGNLILIQRRVPRSDRWQLYTMKPDGSGLRLVTGNKGTNTDASWSPDGARIVFSSDEGTLPSANLYVIAAAGGTPVRVTRDATHEDGAASWSPDGKSIYFESHLSADESSPASIRRIASP